MLILWDYIAGKVGLKQAAFRGKILVMLNELCYWSSDIRPSHRLFRHGRFPLLQPIVSKVYTPRMIYGVFVAAPEIIFDLRNAASAMGPEKAIYKSFGHI